MEKTQNVTPEVKTVFSFFDAKALSMLEKKYFTLDKDARKAADTKYAELKTNAERFIAREITKIANNLAFSERKPVIYGTLLQWGSSFQHLSADNPNKKMAVEKFKELHEQLLADEIDSKEIVGLLKKYKQAQDVTSETPWIVEICKVFGVDPKLLK